ncbi:MAG: hypothetical protein KIT43_15000 [Bauldia sp.]|nr:hypothetical protein [Bauldia sp.]MCW5718221.1 hypothetical protein [Bauldia sp.]
MAGKFLVGAASAALLAFGATGTAQAADVMPVIVPVITPVVVVPTGPKIEISAEQWIEVGLYPAEQFREFNTYSDLDIKVSAASGFGFQFLGEVELWLPSPVELEAAFTGRAFMTRGDIEIGLYSTLWLDGGFDGFAVGTDFTFDNDRFTLATYLQAEFFNGFDEFRTGAEVTVHLGEMLDIGGGVEAEFDFGNFDFEEAWAGVQLHLGPLSPYAVAWWDGGDVGFDLGTELEVPLGTSPFSLLGYAEAEFEIGDPVEFFFGIGIKFSHGN